MLHHVEVYVSNLARSKDFWGWLLEGELGYTRYQEWASGVSWKQNGTYLVFVQAEERFLDIPYHRCRVGLNHLAFYARDREHVEKLREEAARRGISLLYQDRHPHAGGEGHYALFFEDPDRMKVEIVAP
ncbi:MULTISPECIES: VOC family protein [Brevibacillus]|uniref:VOC domain-containing protein n=1 Tax=Brevibacillus brevis TaxID=1393 RepID=A0A2Z4MGR3_BREBE|nr:MULTISPECIES: VOC family protein [Brevibacillus]AWX55686.1 hypothetical protein AB432_011840 [Brevibacillus brevis]NRR20220.1 VOC family protein [Brevibacillus sp. MS2.2]